MSRREPLDQFARLIGKPREPVAVDHEEGADDEDSEAELGHGTRIARTGQSLLGGMGRLRG